ncbi:MAG: hypothetical protein HYZ26_09645 [Chloroflexi bacterium]|nr:hypothetical protein [Chloroflexota bacterium]
MGNRLSEETQIGATSYAYAAANRLTSVAGQSYSWDANGNLLSDGTSTYTYDHANRLVAVGQGGVNYAYAYNGLGDRLRQTVDGVTTTYTLDLAAGQLTGWDLRAPWIERIIYAVRPKREVDRGSTVSLFLYGAGYTAIGMGCTGPILAGLIMHSISFGGQASWIALLVFTATMGTLMLLVSALISADGKVWLELAGKPGVRIKMAGGAILILAGVFNLYSVVWPESFRSVLFP